MHTIRCQVEEPARDLEELGWTKIVVIGPASGWPTEADIRGEAARLIGRDVAVRAIWRPSIVGGTSPQCYSAEYLAEPA